MEVPLSALLMKEQFLHSLWCFSRKFN